jgi:hypothetical protein
MLVCQWTSGSDSESGESESRATVALGPAAARQQPLWRCDPADSGPARPNLNRAGLSVPTLTPGRPRPGRDLPADSDRQTDKQLY